MQAVAQAALQGAGEVLFRGLRAALYERLVAAPLSVLQDQGPPAPAWSTQQADPTVGEGAACPLPPEGSVCPTVCLGLAVDLSGGVSPWLLSTVAALLWVTAACSACAGCCLGLLGPCLWRRLWPFAWPRGAVPAPPEQDRRAARALAYGAPPRPQALERADAQRAGVGVFVGAH